MAIRSRISVGRALGAGAAAWLALNAFAYIAAPLFGVSFGVTARFFGGFLLPGAAAGATALPSVGRIVFFGAALLWSLVYRGVVHYLPGPGWVRGLAFGAAIWLVSGLLLPLFGAIHPNLTAVLPPGSAAGQASFPGLFGLGFAGASGVALSVLAHAVYGGTLGAIAGVQASRT